jgi:pyrimidine deaminase RibD-like protein
MCEDVLRHVGVKRVFYSVDDQTIEHVGVKRVFYSVDDQTIECYKL